MDKMQSIEQLAFIFMNSFNLDIKHGQRIHRDLTFLLYIFSQVHLVVLFYPPPIGKEFRIIHRRLKTAQLIKIGDPSRRQSSR